mmetsp:Transcript_10744/g.16476  ORF Transcript_10744/g.16476 Transcript_10744/m.16476 type:complete len:92 (+) Transcript_10744:127-402(+)
MTTESSVDDESPESDYSHYDYDCDYDYDHGTGDHYLVRKKGRESCAPRFSWKCCCNYLVDAFCFLFAIGFLVFAIWFALYELKNAGNNAGR